MKSKYHHIFWEMYALAYDSLMHVRPYRNYIEHMLKYVAEEGPILDIGCGTANLWIVASDINVKLTLLDGSQVMLSKARNKLRRRDNTEFVQFNIAEIPARKLPFADNTFAQITMGNVLYPHFSPEEILAECERVLAPGGKLIVSEPKPDFRIAKIIQGHIGNGSRFDDDNSLYCGLKMLAKAIMADQSLARHAPALAFIVYCNVLALSKSPTFISTSNLTNLIQNAELSVTSVEDSYEGQNSLIVAEKWEGAIDDRISKDSP